MTGWDAEDYRAHSSAQSAWASQLMDELDLNGDETILDLGCGDGRNTALLAEKVPAGWVTGLDRSPAMISLSVKSDFCRALPNLSFVLGDIRSLPLRSSFQLVFSNSVLHWVRDPLPVLKEIAAVLLPGGKILLQMGGQGNAADIFRIADSMIHELSWAQYFSGFSSPYGFYGPEEYEPWLREAGFDPLRLELIPMDMVQEGRENLEGWIRTTWHPYIDRIPTPRRPAFIREIAARYHRRYPPDASAKYHVRMVRLEIGAQKPG